PGLRVFAGVMIVGRRRDGVVGKSGRKRGGEVLQGLAKNGLEWNSSSNCGMTWMAVWLSYNISPCG
nr:hypothetical protein [Tanacetum cinerariifolium]